MKLLFENFRNFLITEAEGQTLYHIGKRPASPNLNVQVGILSRAMKKGGIDPNMMSQ